MLVRRQLLIATYKWLESLSSPKLAVVSRPHLLSHQLWFGFLVLIPHLALRLLELFHFLRARGWNLLVKRLRVTHSAELLVRLVLHMRVLAFSLKDVAWDTLLSTFHHIRIIKCFHNSRVVNISYRVIRSVYLRDGGWVGLVAKVRVEISMVSSIDRRWVLFRLAEGVARIHQLLSSVMRARVLLFSIVACHRDTTILIRSVKDRLAQFNHILHLNCCIMRYLGRATGSLVESVVRVLTSSYLSGWVLNPCHLTDCSSSCLDIATNWPSCWSFLWSVYGDSAPLIIDWCRREAALASRFDTSFSASRVRCSSRDDCSPSLWVAIHLLVVGLQVRFISTWIPFMRWLMVFWSSSVDPLRWLGLLCMNCLWIWIEKT